MDDQNKKQEEQRSFTYDPEKKERENERDDPYASVRKETEPYTFGPFGTSPTYGPSEPATLNSTVTEVTPSATREYRPFTVSGGAVRNEWAAKPPRRSSFKSMFAAFLAGVVVVGGLMFAADRGDWFSADTIGSTKQVQENAVKASTTPVTNTDDVVRPNNIAKIFEQASPAVVKIETYASTQQSNGGSIFEDDFFRQFFGDSYGNGNKDDKGGTQGELQQSGMGSGFIFDSTGYILTNEHVVNGAKEIKVMVDGYESPLKATLLGSSYELDLAVLKIEGSNFPTLKLGDSSGLNMGEWVVAIGNPYGFDHTITVGVLSSNEREISIADTNGTRNYQHLLQTDASINPGNSGGPLLNLKGEVIGINTAVSSQAQGIGFAIPTSTITEVLENLKSNTKIPQEPIPFIGATLMNVTEDIAQRLGIDASVKGAFIREVMFNTPAYKADLRQYDVITGMDGKEFATMEELIAAIQKKTVGDKVNLDVLRGDKQMEVTVEIGDRNAFETQ
jgi:serine protease Do